MILTKFPQLTPLMAVVILTAYPTQAAEITWSVSNITGNVSEVSNAGITVIAASGADGGATADVVDGTVWATPNGVSFTDNFTMDTPSHKDTLNSRANASVSGEYYKMLQFADRQGSGLATWTFNSLTVGNTYQIQVWAQDKNSVAGAFGHVLNKGGINTPVLNASGHALILIEASGENTPGQYALGTFVADATTQQFQARAYQNLTTTPTTASNITINAYQLRDLGFTGPDVTAPTPSPMTWASVPAPAGDSSITMTATTATDDSGVEYLFDETSGNPGGTDSGWQNSPTYTDSGLNASTQYTYTVTARDKATVPNAGTASSPASATTDAPDTSAPTPNPMTFAIAPAAIGPNSISMTATTASDPSGVEYFFDETSGNPGGTDSGWQVSPAYTDSGLNSNTQYTYKVTARDKATNPNTTAASSAASAASATTDQIDDVPPSPNPMTFSVAPTATSSSAITMTASTASDPSGVEYLFDETSGNPGGTDSGWQASSLSDLGQAR